MVDDDDDDAGAVDVYSVRLIMGKMHSWAQAYFSTCYACIDEEQIHNQ